MTALLAAMEAALMVGAVKHAPLLIRGGICVLRVPVRALE